jgi:hypothetical protein
MKLPIYARFELRNNSGMILRMTERLTVIDTELPDSELMAQMRAWAADTGEVFGMSVALRNVDKETLKRDIIRASIAESQR